MYTAKTGHSLFIPSVGVFIYSRCQADEILVGTLCLWWIFFFFPQMFKASRTQFHSLWCILLTIYQSYICRQAFSMYLVKTLALVRQYDMNTHGGGGTFYTAEMRWQERVAGAFFFFRPYAHPDALDESNSLNRSNHLCKEESHK